jgi:hypothetical protein
MLVILKEIDEPRFVLDASLYIEVVIIRDKSQEVAGRPNPSRSASNRRSLT